MNKLQQLTEIEGYSDPIDMIEEHFTDTMCPGICVNPECDYTTSVEQDCRAGWCEECGTQTVVSAFELAGII